MRNYLFAAICCFSSVTMAQSADSKHWQDLLDHHKFTLLNQQIQQQPDYLNQIEPTLMRVKALHGLQQSDQLASLLDQALPLYPKHAELRLYAALNHFNQAQAGSIFAAPGHAKKGLALLKEAATLDPANMDIQQTLIGFYSEAPGIAGGDEDEAKRLADELFQRDPTQGSLARSFIMLSADKANEALTLIEQQLETAATDTDLLQRKAEILSKLNRNSEAWSFYQQVIALQTAPNEKYAALYQLGRLAASAKQDPAVGKAALQQYLEYYQDSDDHRYGWAQLRLAQIHLAEKDPSTATNLVKVIQQRKDSDSRLQKEIKALEKQLKKRQS